MFHRRGAAAEERSTDRFSRFCWWSCPHNDSAFASASRRILDIGHLSADIPDSSLPRTPPLATESNSCVSFWPFNKINNHARPHSQFAYPLLGTCASRVPPMLSILDWMSFCVRSKLGEE